VSHVLLPNIQSAWDVAVPFQEEDARFAAANNSVVLGHETGLGKTFIALLAWSLWPQAQKGLIVGSLASCATWARLLRHWGGTQTTHIYGNNQTMWQEAIQARTGIWTCTYSTFLWLMKGVIRGKPEFDVLINDELHKTMRRRNQTWKALKRLEFEHYIGCSATWASRGPQDLFPVLNLVNHRTFSSYWKFVETWCYVEKSNFGTQIFGVKNLDNLRKMLWSQYFRSRTWPEVGVQFLGEEYAGQKPVVRRQEVVPMSAQQTKIIDDLDRDMIAILNEEMIVTPNSLTALTRKMQVAISPKILMPSADYGGPVEWLAAKIEDDPHTVVFCPFIQGLDIVRQKLIDDGRPAEDIFILRGGVKMEEVYQIIDRWKACKGVLLCTISFAQSFPADSTNTAYALGFMWDPNDNSQMEGRLRRLDSIIKSPCLVTYIIPEHSDYEVVREVVNGKLMNTRTYLEGYAKNVTKISPRGLPMLAEEEGEDDVPE
jgi:hypothetical protein